MNKVSIIDELQLIELAEDDDLSAFNSSSEDLNDFLKKDAWIYQKNLMALNIKALEHFYLRLL